MRMMDGLRQAKHQAFLVSKKLRRTGAAAALRDADRRGARREEKHPFTYTEGMFPHTFLRRPDPEGVQQEEVPAVLWVIWLGGPPPPRRARSLQALREQAGVDVRVVAGPEDVLVEGQPFHAAYGDLHVVHRSDYLRAYALHHHGGAYLDVKPQTAPVRELIDTMNDDPDAWVMGYREVTSAYVPDLPHSLGAHLRAHYRAVLGTSAFICRPRSQFTTEWMRELHARLDFLQEPLREADASGCDPYGAPAGYPIRWTEILGDITQPLSLKHQSHLRFSDRLRPQLEDYR